MKDWFTVEPDKFALVGPHRYTAGRGGASIQYVTRHHIMGNMTTERVRDLWNNEREASAHYVVENSGLIGQIVYDRDTAWSNGNASSNRVSLSIEHANNTGRHAGNDYHDLSWNISDTVLREGARLAAALCWFYKLGRPVLGKNIRDHNEFTATGCPVHLRRGSKYSDTWMRYATEHFDWMVREAAGHNNPQEGFLMALSDAEQRELLDKTRRIDRELTQLYPSRSAYAHTDKPIDTLAGMVLNADARIHEDWVHARAAEAGMDPAEWAAKQLGGQS